MSAISGSSNVAPPTPSASAAPAATAAAASSTSAGTVDRSAPSSGARHAATIPTAEAELRAAAQGYRFSDGVLDSVLADFGLSDAAAVVRVAVSLDNGNRYLNRSEIEQAARQLQASGGAASGGSGGTAGGATGPVDPDALAGAVRGAAPAFRFSVTVLADVLTANGLDASEGAEVLKLAADLDTENRYLNRGELTRAAATIAASSGSTGGAGGTGVAGGSGGATPSTVGTATIADLRVSPGALGYVEAALSQLSGPQAAEVRTLLREAASIDQNQVLSPSEARSVIEPVLAALPGGGGAVLAAIAGIDRDLDAERAREADLSDGIDVLFNSGPKDERPSLSGRIISELDEAVAEADGRQLDIAVMIFAFTDQAIADKIVEIARDNPNANVRILTDWAQAGTSGGRKPGLLASLGESEATIRSKYSGSVRSKMLAARQAWGVPAEGLQNLEVHFKKDQPYRWSDSQGRPVWNHATTRGLNHHKGLVTLIEGKPQTLISGSFNWSPTAEKSNYENLMVLDKGNAANRSVMRSYADEFEAFWNDGRASLTLLEAKEHRRLINAELGPGVDPASVDGLDSGAGDNIAILDDSDVPDINGWLDGQAVADLLGGGPEALDIARGMHAERLRYGRFTDLADLVDRLPAVGDLDPAVLDRLTTEAVFGDGRVRVNDASSEELQAIGLPAAEANALIGYREANGDFEDLASLRGVAGLTGGSLDRVEKHLTTVIRRVAFSARMAHEAAGDTGYARANEERTVAVMGADGVVRNESATLGSGAVDMIRRAEPGDTLELAAYGLSGSTAEYAALAGAARRGVKLRVVLNKAFNQGIAQSLRDLKDGEGLDVEVKVSSKTMHQKYLLNRSAADVFNGSANLSGSASRKHSEDRFFLKNNPSVAAEFGADFDRLWARLS